MNWNNAYRPERDDFKKLKAVKGSLKARWDDRDGDWEDYGFEDDEPEAEGWKSESAVKWSGYEEDPREALPGWKTSLRSAARH